VLEEAEELHPQEAVKTVVQDLKMIFQVVLFIIVQEVEDTHTVVKVPVEQAAVETQIWAILQQFVELQQAVALQAHQQLTM
jgi:hypothetical protein